MRPAAAGQYREIPLLQARDEKPRNALAQDTPTRLAPGNRGSVLACAARTSTRPASGPLTF